MSNPSTPQALLALYQGQIVPRSFNAGFVALSYVVSLIGAASTLELINRRTAPKGIYNHLLLLGAAVTMGGIAIWCMHFIGNRAIDLAAGETELQIAYSGGFTALSFFVPIGVLLAAFIAIGTNNVVSWWRVVIGGSLAGTAICGMHYLGNASIDNYTCHYNPVNVIGAALIAATASMVALAIFFVFRAAWTNSWWKRLSAAVVMAGAISGMHWCASTGTEYSLIQLNDGTNQVSRNTTVIVVICLSVGACIMMAGFAAYSAHTKQRYARKAQKVVLAAAVFDKHGRILVSPDGLLPSEKITDSFLEKNHGDMFSTSHPLFHWMFQASWNWSGISALLSGMANHLAHLQHLTRDRDARTGIKLINEHGELIENYNLIVRELFCVAAMALASKMKEQLTSVGILWDEILPTGATGERPGEAARRRQQEADDMLQQSADPASRDPSPVDLAEKGLGRRRHHEYGRGSLMFLVRRVESDRDVEKLEAAGYRFAEVRQVSAIIGSSMQVTTTNIEGKLHEMASYAEGANKLNPGVHLGFFGVRARVGSAGFDVLVRRSAGSLLPSVQLPMDRLEAWQADMLRSLDGLTLPAMQKRLGAMNKLPPREALFATQLTDAAAALRDWVDDGLLDEAVLTARTVGVPCQRWEEGSGPEMATLIAFRRPIPIHVGVSNTQCEFIPLNFFKVRQVCGASSEANSAFVRAVHRELAPVFDSVPALQGGIARDGVARRPSAFMRLGRPRSALPVDADGIPIPTRVSKKSSESNKSTSTLKLWSWRTASARSPAPSGKSGYEPPPSYTHDAPPPEPRAFGGIMVSQDITVEVEPEDAGADADTAHSRSSGGARGPSSEARPAVASGPAAIEMRKLRARESADVHTGAVTQVSNVGVELAGCAATTFVDELFATCMENR